MIETDEERGDAEDECERAAEVDAFELGEPMRFVARGKLESEGDGDNGEDGDGDLEQERPAKEPNKLDFCANCVAVQEDDSLTSANLLSLIGCPRAEHQQLSLSQNRYSGDLEEQLFDIVPR